MKLGYTKKVNLIVGLSFLMGPTILALTFLVPQILLHAWILVGLILVAQVSLIIGCCLYAIGKGHHPALGLLGLLYIPGLIILAFFPDKHKGEDTNSGCLMTFLIFLVFFVLIFGLGIFSISRKFKNTGSANANSDQLKQSMMKLHVTVLSSTHSGIEARIRALDSLLKEGNLGLEKVKEVHGTLIARPNKSKDDEIILRRIEESLAAAGPAPAEIPIVTSTAPAAVAITTSTQTAVVQPAIKKKASAKKKGVRKSVKRKPKST